MVTSIVIGSGVGVATAATTAVPSRTYPRFCESCLVEMIPRRVTASTPIGIWNSRPTTASSRIENL